MYSASTFWQGCFEVKFTFNLKYYNIGIKKYHRFKKTPVTGVTELQATIECDGGLITYFNASSHSKLLFQIYMLPKCVNNTNLIYNYVNLF